MCAVRTTSTAALVPSSLACHVPCAWRVNRKHVTRERPSPRPGRAPGSARALAIWTASVTDGPEVRAFVFVLIVVCIVPRMAAFVGSHERRGRYGDGPSTLGRHPIEVQTGPECRHRVTTSRSALDPDQDTSDGRAVPLIFNSVLNIVVMPRRCARRSPENSVSAQLDTTYLTHQIIRLRSVAEADGIPRLNSHAAPRPGACSGRQSVCTSRARHRDSASIPRP
jgi:hypothetical protein